MAIIGIHGPAMAMEIEGAAWGRPLDHYCERTAPGFWDEPANALSNIGFIVAAAFVLARERDLGWTDRPVVALALLAAGVGVGSLLFHTFANQWSFIADVLPIALFIYAYFFLALRRFMGFAPLPAILGVGGLLLLSPVLTRLLQPVLGPSAVYVPGLITTFGIAAAVPLLGRGPAPTLLTAARVAFVLALVFRALDHPVCEAWPVGTHFLWHLFNAAAVALALLAAERVSPYRNAHRHPTQLSH